MQTPLTRTLSPKGRGKYKTELLSPGGGEDEGEGDFRSNDHVTTLDTFATVQERRSRKSPC